MEERIVHATSGDTPRGELVRYDKAGKWYIEWPGRNLPRQQVTINQAVETAIYWWYNGGSPHFDRDGGARFNTLLRKRVP
jgi:hypothetical protein